jgi:FeS assembly SUF system regulator
MARSGEAADGSQNSARELAERVDLPVPVVSKVLKTLTRAGILESHRGSKGGYSLVRRAELLTVAEMITALDGPLALTQCSASPSVCDLEDTCAIRNPWQVINQVVHHALASVTLADLTNPDFAAQHAPLATLGFALGGLGDPDLTDLAGADESSDPSAPPSATDNPQLRANEVQ